MMRTTDLELLLKAKENRVAELEREYKRLNALAEKGDITSDLVDAIAGNKVRLDLARRGADQVKEKAEADAKWRKSKAYKAEENDLADMRKDAEKSLADCVDHTRKLLLDLKDLRVLVKKHDRLAKSHEKQVLSGESSFGIMFRLQHHLEKFSEEYRLWVDLKDEK